MCKNLHHGFGELALFLSPKSGEGRPPNSREEGVGVGKKMRDTIFATQIKRQN